MATLTLEAVEKLLDSLSPKELFAQHSYKDLAFATHPDRNPGEPRATVLFDRVAKAWEAKDAPPVLIKGSRHTYTLGRLIAAGDIADVYEGASGSSRYILKIARVPGSHAYLDVEQKHVARLLKEAGDSVYRLYVPTLVESFPAKDKIQKRVNVFAHPGKPMYTFKQVVEKHPKLDGRHIAWIFRRLCEFLEFASRHKIVHGAILPEHVLIDVAGHGVQLCGWGQSVETGQPVKIIASRYASWYPPEVIGKKPTAAATDLYMVGRLMLSAAAGTPDRMKAFFKSLTLPGVLMRPDSPARVYDDFAEVITRVYGPKKFVALSME